MYLVRMVYVSKIVNRLDSGALPQIQKVAMANNDKHDLTGLLVFSSKYYLQVIEGGRKAINQLLRNLHHDDRHADLLVLGMEQINQRSFQKWSMQFVPVTSASREVFLRNGVSQEYDPYEMTYLSALGFLNDMKESES